MGNVCNRVPAANAPGCTAAEGLLYKPWSLVFPSARDPTSERRNYLGEKWPVIWTESCDFHAYNLGFFFRPDKIQQLRPALNPLTWAPKASTLPLDHRSMEKSALKNEEVVHRVKEERNMVRAIK